MEDKRHLVTNFLRQHDIEPISNLSGDQVHVLMTTLLEQPPQSTPDLGDAETVFAKACEDHGFEISKLENDWPAAHAAAIAAMHSYASSLKGEVETVRGLLKAMVKCYDTFTGASAKGSPLFNAKQYLNNL